MNLLEAIILGIIQGLTEFLPVSSSGHLEIGKFLFGIDAEKNIFFTIAVHGATVLSTLVVFRREIATLLSGLFRFKMNEETSYVLKLIVSMIPVGITGVFFKDSVEQLFNGNMIFVGSMLLVTAVMLASGHFMKRKERAINYFDAFIIGIAQAVAVIPGISRSGATISTGMMLGNKKDELAKFSFLMVLVPVIGANLLDVASGDMTSGSTSAMVILAGALSAFVSGLLACSWMISLVRKSKILGFSIYCAILGLLAIFIL
ncbi:MAG: undecaprenyl-diphosphate phosphatase [Bacteroidales bacterium]|nr:undecaprenyl-diphosphate phosphatase [Bacteroidales bacterium]